MGIPSDNKNQVNRTRDPVDPSASSLKPMLNENKDAGLRGDDKRQGALRDEKLRNEDLPNNGIINPE